MHVIIRFFSLLIMSFSLISFILFPNQVFAASGLKVFVDLYHDEKGSANICVFSNNQDLGCDIIKLSQYNSPVELGPWQFSTGVIPEGDSFTVCVTNSNTNKEVCKDGTNTPKKAPEYIKITVPSSPFSFSKDTNNQISGLKNNPLNINWGQVCVGLDNLFPNLITVSCSKLTTNNGYSLTPQGERVFDKLLNINWKQICDTVNILDPTLITSSCSKLTTNNGYSLTVEGKRQFIKIACDKSDEIMWWITPLSPFIAPWIGIPSYQLVAASNGLSGIVSQTCQSMR